MLIIVPAMLVNFALAKAILRFGYLEKPRQSRLTLIAGIVFNIAFLGYFKYTNFVVTAANDLFGSDYTLHHIVLPLGISFITFQKIAFLIDVHGKRIESFRFPDFCSFILFFPQLIAGPIVHYREMMPQFHSARCAWDKENISVGITLFTFGLFKKVILADSIAPFVSSIYASAETGVPISMLPAWLAAIGFTFQIYFDFSGYTDMALGSARLFGIRLPVNFNSPLRSSCIIDFWLRWHVSLTRFLTAYLYNPIALSLTRRRLAAGRDGFNARKASPGAFVQLLMFPTIFTMLISGFWHGAGYLFILWGLLHGIYLAINHGWRLLVQRFWSRSERYSRVLRLLGSIVTFICVATSMVLFRSTTFDSASNILQGLVGINGIEIPPSIYNRLLAVSGWFADNGISASSHDFADVKALTIWLFLLAPLVFLLPNTLQILDRFEPAIGITPSSTKNFIFGLHVNWRTSPAWALFIAMTGFFAVLHIGGYSEFLYWKF